MGAVLPLPGNIEMRIVGPSHTACYSIKETLELYATFTLQHTPHCSVKRASSLAFLILLIKVAYSGNNAIANDSLWYKSCVRRGGL